jgi:hypothetical protein
MVNDTGAFLDGNNESETTFVNHVESYVDDAKCQTVLDGGIGPALLSLSGSCSMKQIREDATSCQALCSIVACCFSSSGENCPVESFMLASTMIRAKT